MFGKLIFHDDFVSTRCFRYLRTEFQKDFDKLIRFVEILPDDPSDKGRSIIHVNGELNVHFDRERYAAYIDGDTAAIRERE